MEGGYANGKVVANLPTRLSAPTADIIAKRRPVSRVPVGTNEKENQFRGPARRPPGPPSGPPPPPPPPQVGASAQVGGIPQPPRSMASFPLGPEPDFARNSMYTPPPPSALSAGVSPRSSASVSPELMAQGISPQTSHNQLSMPPFPRQESPQPRLSGDDRRHQIKSQIFAPDPRLAPRASTNIHTSPTSAPSVSPMQQVPPSSSTSPFPSNPSRDVQNSPPHVHGHPHRRNSSSHSIHSTTGLTLRNVPSHSTIRYQAEFYSGKHDRSNSGGLNHKATRASIQSQSSQGSAKRYSTSAYVKELRRRSATAYSEVSARQWGLPIGISSVAPLSSSSTMASTKSSKSSNGPTFRRTMDIRHTHLQPRLLASEVDDDDEDDIADLQSPVSSVSGGGQGISTSSITGATTTGTTTQSSTPHTHTTNNSTASVVLTDQDTTDTNPATDSSPKPSRRSRASSSSSSLDIDEGVGKLKLFVANPDSD